MKSALTLPLQFVSYPTIVASLFWFRDLEISFATHALFVRGGSNLSGIRLSKQQILMLSDQVGRYTELGYLYPVSDLRDESRSASKPHQRFSRILVRYFGGLTGIFFQRTGNSHARTENSSSDQFFEPTTSAPGSTASRST